MVLAQAAVLREMGRVFAPEIVQTLDAEAFDEMGAVAEGRPQLIALHFGVAHGFFVVVLHAADHAGLKGLNAGCT
ncbi:hypothetical protein D3C80_1642370 [compost metagenome]